MYCKVKQLTTKNAHSGRCSAIKDNKGLLLTQPEEITSRWKEYVELLYHKQGKPESLELEDVHDIQEDDRGPSLLDAEIKTAIAEMKNHKALDLIEYQQNSGKTLVMER